MSQGSVRAEAWAQIQLGALHPIDFPKEWSDEERSVSGEFVLKALLDSRWSEAPSSLILKNAIVTTPVEAVYAKLEADLEVRDCLFKSAIRLPCAKAARRLRFFGCCLLYTSPSPRDLSTARMPSSA